MRFFPFGEKKGGTTRDSNRRDTKEGCEERSARCGTLSQNGYGENTSALAGTDKAVRSRKPVVAGKAHDPGFEPMRYKRGLR